MRRVIVLVLGCLALAGCVTGPNVGGQPEDGWKLAWRDEFNGTTLDASLWTRNWFSSTRYSNPVNGREDACYDAQLVSVSDGALHLGTATNADSTCRRRDGSTAPYRGAHVNTNGKHDDFRYVFFEARVRFAGDGNDLFNWPAWWTNGQNHPEDCEFDIAEVLSDHRPSWHIHHSGGTEDGRPSDNGNGWHTYGLRWTENGQTFYYDGANVGSASVTCDAPHYMILANQINQDYGVHVPATMDVDWVRVWRR